MAGAKHDITVTLGANAAELTNTLDAVTKGVVSAFSKMATVAAGAFAGVFAVSKIQSAFTAAVAKGKELDQLSRSTGAAVKDIELLRVSLIEADVSASAAAEMLAELRDNMFFASKGATDLHIALGMIGLRVRDLQALKPVQQFAAIAAALNRIREPTIRLRAAKGILGSGADAAANLRPEQLARMQAAFGAFASTQQRAAPHFAALAASWTRIVEAMRAIFATIVAKVAPTIQRIVERVEALAPKLLAIAERVGEAIRKWFNALDGAIKTSKLGEFLQLSFAVAMDKLFLGMQRAASVFITALSSFAPIFTQMLVVGMKMAAEAFKAASAFKLDLPSTRHRIAVEISEQMEREGLIPRRSAPQLADALEFQMKRGWFSPDLSITDLESVHNLGLVTGGARGEERTKRLKELSEAARARLPEAQRRISSAVQREAVYNPQLASEMNELVKLAIASVQGGGEALKAAADKIEPSADAIKREADLKRLMDILMQRGEEPKTEPLPGEGKDARGIGRILYQHDYDIYRRIGGGAGDAMLTQLDLEKEQAALLREIADNTKQPVDLDFDKAVLEQLRKGWTPGRLTEDIERRQVEIERQAGAAAMADEEWRANAAELARRELVYAAQGGQDIKVLAEQAMTQFRDLSEWMATAPVGGGETEQTSRQIERERLRIRADTMAAAVQSAIASATTGIVDALLSVSPPTVSPSNVSPEISKDREAAAGRGIAPDFMSAILGGSPMLDTGAANAVSEQTTRLADIMQRVADNTAEMVRLLQRMLSQQQMRDYSATMETY